MIQNFGGGELLVILILALVVLGPERIPEMAKSAGKMIAKLKTMSSGLQGQVQGVMDDPAMQPLRELGDLAARPRQKLAEYALEAEADERARSERVSIDAATESGAAAEPTGTDPAEDASTGDGSGDGSSDDTGERETA
ncbi:MAG TPA: twin-arginine translocase TatA/TatE family subunit [Microthrixaceae bacterium]|nr:twin-arginine translocase TatA/TatE family subunit [Microthrixaceae bacterium]HNE37494.1 twin-arginine translocase TatA/TatE family subunit [Microthrixaceae bacterium]HNH95521.1 twin-arginine translocase TatA/TatE family subunit [Microthrixaceae bacterium]